MSKHPHYIARVESLTGLRSNLTLQITGTDPQGAFDWCCGHRGLKRVSNLVQRQEEATMNTNPSYAYLDKWSRRHAMRSR
jgi:hypothetical protein